MERFKSTLAATAAIALGLATAAHIRHPGDLSPVPRAEAAALSASEAAASSASEPAAPAARAWTPAQRELLAMMAGRAADGRAVRATVAAFADARS